MLQCLGSGCLVMGLGWFGAVLVGDEAVLTKGEGIEEGRRAVAVAAMAVLLLLLQFHLT